MDFILLDRTGQSLRDQLRDALFNHGLVVVKNFHVVKDLQQFLRSQ